jgi:excisionase family DNA binding protein
MDATLIHHMSLEQITKLFADLQSQISDLKQYYEPKQPAEYLTRNEVAELLKCDLSTLYNWAKKGKLVPYGIGNRVYYKRAEIEKALIKI